MDVAPLAYNPFARLLHWAVAALILGEFAVALSMPDVHRGTEETGLLLWHVGIGTSVLALMLVRLGWRLGSRVPAPAGAGWQDVAARWVHAALYAGFLLLPLLGWANASGRGWAIHLAGLVSLPALAPTGASWARPLGDLHALLAWGLLALIGLHVAAALQHQLLLRDNLMRRMWPGPLPQRGEQD